MRTDPTYINSLTQSLNNMAGTANSLANQLSTGLRVNSLSDDPSAAATSLRFGSEIARADTFVQTASNQASMLQTTDSTLGEVVAQLTVAISLAVQAANGTNNSSNMQALRTQAVGIRDQVLSLANASYQGTFLFAGSQGRTQPFSLDTTTTPAGVAYAGDASVQSIETPGGQKIQMNLAGDAVFGSGTSGVLAALNQLISDMSNGAASAALRADSSTLSEALSNVSTQRALLDASLSTLTSTSRYTQTQEANLKAVQGTLVASDPAAIATDIKNNQVQYQALLSVISSLNKTNLFDYLR